MLIVMDSSTEVFAFEGAAVFAEGDELLKWAQSNNDLSFMQDSLNRVLHFFIAVWLVPG